MVLEVDSSWMLGWRVVELNADDVGVEVRRWGWVSCWIVHRNVVCNVVMRRQYLLSEHGC